MTNDPFETPSTSNQSYEANSFISEVCDYVISCFSDHNSSFRSGRMTLIPGVASGCLLTTGARARRFCDIATCLYGRASLKSLIENIIW